MIGEVSRLVGLDGAMIQMMLEGKRLGNVPECSACRQSERDLSKDGGIRNIEIWSFDSCRRRWHCAKEGVG